MTPEATQRVVDSAPSVWACGGFTCDDGWAQILIDLGPKLAKAGAVIGGVKEKYARLEFYVREPKPPYGTSEIESLLKQATEKSMDTCEVCGEPGRLCANENQWEKTVCRQHRGGEYQPYGPDQEYVEAYDLSKMPNPTPEMQADPVWEAIWQTIKSWDVNVPAFYQGYCGANGSHATLIYEAVKKAQGPVNLATEEDGTEVTKADAPMALKREERHEVRRLADAACDLLRKSENRTGSAERKLEAALNAYDPNWPTR